MIGECGFKKGSNRVTYSRLYTNQPTVLPQYQSATRSIVNEGPEKGTNILRVVDRSDIPRGFLSFEAMNDQFVIFSEIGWVLEFEIPNDSKRFGMIHSFACLVYRPCVLTFQYAEIRENMAGQSGSKMKGAATQILYLCRKSTYIYVPKCFYRFCLQ